MKRLKSPNSGAYIPEANRQQLYQKYPHQTHLPASTKKALQRITLPGDQPTIKFPQETLHFTKKEMQRILNGRDSILAITVLTAVLATGLVVNSVVAEESSDAEIAEFMEYPPESIPMEEFNYVIDGIYADQQAAAAAAAEAEAAAATEAEFVAAAAAMGEDSVRDGGCIEVTDKEGNVLRRMCAPN